MYLCGTHAVGTVSRPRSLASGRGPDDVVIPVVGECDDGEMADSRTVVGRDVERALEALGAEVAEGSVGAGHRDDLLRLPGRHRDRLARVGDHHVGVLLLCNFGDREYLDLLGAGRRPAELSPRGRRSCRGAERRGNDRPPTGRGSDPARNPKQVIPVPAPTLPSGTSASRSSSARWTSSRLP